MKYFGSHFGMEDSAPWSPKFINFVFVIQGAFVQNSKSEAQIGSEIWKMKYFGGDLGIEDSDPWGPKFTNLVFIIQETAVANF